MALPQITTAEDVEAIEGVVLHEIAHRVLEHGTSEKASREKGRAANRLVKKWGFTRELEKAIERFGESKCEEKEEEK